MQHESDDLRYGSCTHPIGYDDLGTSFLVFRIAVDAVMKLSDAGDCETNAMTLATEHTAVPVPPVLLVIHSDKRVPGRRYTIIRYILGQNLEECWATLSWWRKAIILWTLRRDVRRFRKIPLGNRPPGPIGDGPQVCNGPAFTEVYVCIGLPLSFRAMISISTDCTRDPGPLQPTKSCLLGSHADRSFLKNINTPTEMRRRSTHLCRSFSPTSTSRQEI